MTVGTSRIVVGVDGSSTAELAVRWAAREAVSRRARLVLAFAYEHPEVHADRATTAALPGGLLGWAQTCLGRAAERARAAAPAVVLVKELVPGRTVEGLARLCAEAELLVLGHRGVGAVAAVVTGSLAERALGSVSCPVVVVGSGVRGVPGSRDPVVVGVDTGPGCATALEFAFDHAARHGRPLVAVHARPGSRPVLGSAGDPWRRAAARVLDEQLAGWRAKYPDVPFRYTVQPGTPAAALGECGRRASLLVVGARGGPAGRLLGSTIRALLGRAECPVVVVRAPGRPETRRHIGATADGAGPKSLPGGR